MTGIHQLLMTNFLSGVSDQTASILVVAGGGGGGPASYLEALGGVVPKADGSTAVPQGGRGAGGGAGGLIFLDSEFPMVAGTEYTITVGTGAFMSRKGSNSVVTGGGRTLTAIGGGAGGERDSNSNSMDKGGGSGGGAWYGNGQIGGCATQTANTSDGITTYDTTGFGNKGGDGCTPAPYGGGGGGAGEVGGTGSNDILGNNGGIGKEINILGSSDVYYAGGGMSVGHTTALQASATTAGAIHLNTGHKGGGGFGDNSVNTTAGTTLTNGVPNTGGGGGSGGNGGKGIVIIRLPKAASSTTGAPSETTVGGEIAYYFSSDGTLTI